MARQGDLTLVASKVEAANEAYLYAGQDLNVLAAQDSDYSLYDMKKKGSFGAKKTKRDEVTDVRNIGSEIKAGGDITLKSEGDQTYQAAKLSSGKDLTLDSGGDITFEAVKDLHQESHEKSSSNLAWQSAKGKGTTDETLRQSELVAQGQLAIQAANKIHIDVKDINAQTVSQTVDAMVKADPNLAWIKQAEERGDIDWRQVKEMHDSFKYSHSGLGQGAMLAVIIVVTVLTAGAASAAVGTMAGATAGSGTAMAAAGTVTTAATATTAATTTAVAAGWANVAATAALTSMASSGAVSLINNRGNIGATLKDTLSSDGLKNAMIAAGTAGVMSYAGSNWFKTTVDPVSGKVTGAIPDITNPGNFTRFAETQLLQGAVKGTLSEALGQGKFSDSLKGSVFSILQAAAFNQVGNLGKQWDLQDSGLGKTAMHAVVGGLLSEAMGGDFKTGAVAAGANEALIETLDKSPLLASTDQTQHQRLVNMASQLVGLVAAASVGGNVQQGAEIAGNAQAYNRQLHTFERKLIDEKAQELQGTLGNSKSGLSWGDLLSYVAGAAVDSDDSQRLAALKASLSDSNPENLNLKQDLAQAQQIIDEVRSQRIALTWGNGDSISAHGDQVYAFDATEAQRQDHGLFNLGTSVAAYNSLENTIASGGYTGREVPAEFVKQFGSEAASQHLNEIIGVSTYNGTKETSWQALQDFSRSGINTSTADLDLILSLPIGAKAGIAAASAMKGVIEDSATALAGGLSRLLAGSSERSAVNDLAKIESPRIDYSRGFESDLINFNSGHALVSGPLEKDLVLVSYHVDTPFGVDRSAKWWTTTEQANKIDTIDDIHQKLALLPEWGLRESVSVAKIPKGTDIEAYFGTAKAQRDQAGNVFEGGGVQYRFKDFDPSWIYEVRKMP